MAMLQEARVPANAPRAAVYVRVSTVGQEEDGTSLGTQEAACLAHASTRGGAVDPAHLYREVHTGTELWERPQLQRLREAIRRREVDVVICYAIDRLSRDPVHLGVLISEAEHAGVDIVFVTEPLDNSPEGQLIRFVRGYAAKVEHEKIRERSIRGRLARAEAGKLLPGRRPLYGYRFTADRAGYEPDPLTAPVVGRIFLEAVGGASLRSIAVDLDRAGVPTASGRPGARWLPAAVHHILRHPSYCGRAAAWRHASTRGRGQMTRTMRLRPDGDHVALPAGVVPALVDETTFEAVQARLKLGRQRSVRNARDPEVALLRGGYARCGYCGRSLRVWRSSTRARGDFVGYRCARADKLPGACEGFTINARTLDGAAWGRIERILTNPEIVADELRRLRRDDPTAADLAAVDRQLAEIERQQRAKVAHLDKLDPDSAALLYEQLALLSERRKALEAERDGIAARRRGWQEARGRLDELEAWCRNVAGKVGRLTWEQKRLALDALGVGAKVWHSNHDPHFEITAGIPMKSASVSESACQSGMDRS